MSKTFEEWFGIKLWEYPYDSSHAQEHFQTESEYIVADSKYRDEREKELSLSAWDHKEQEIKDLKEKVEEAFERGYLQGQNFTICEAIGLLKRMQNELP